MSNSPAHIQVKHAAPVQLPSFSAEDDSTISFAEANVHIPFGIKRIYYIRNFLRPGITRGGHAHRTLQQVIFCLSGYFLFHLDDGTVKQDVAMDEPTQGMLIGAGLWHNLVDIEPGTVILALASDYYDESDYIRDYQEFLQFVKG